MRVYIICGSEIHQSLVYLTYLTILLINKQQTIFYNYLFKLSYLYDFTLQYQQ